MRTAKDTDENCVSRELENTPHRKRTLFIKINTRKGTAVNYNSSSSRSWKHLALNHFSESSWFYLKVNAKKRG